jgi:hypothetical protein
MQVLHQLVRAAAAQYGKDRLGFPLKKLLGTHFHALHHQQDAGPLSLQRTSCNRDHDNKSRDDQYWPTKHKEKNVVCR